MTAIKHDQHKLDLTLFPIESIEAGTRALAFGAAKYSRGNYRSGPMAYSRLVAACLRHLFAWLYGETQDPESGLSHLDHAIASLAMLAFQVKHHPEADDRYPAINKEAK